MERSDLDLAGVGAYRLSRLRGTWSAERRRAWSVLAALERCEVLIREEGRLQSPYDQMTPVQFFTMVAGARDEVRYAERQVTRIEARLLARRGSR